LSGGEAQRVALARALATSPRLLLLDEPLSALDATTRAAVRRDLHDYLSSHEGVRVLVTHDPLEAMALADRLVILEEGRIVQEGTGAEITAHPRSAYAAALVGVNLLEGSVDAGEVRIDRTIRLRVAGPVGGTDAVFAVVHPRSVSLHRARPEGSARNVWAGEAESVDAEGDRVRVRVRLSAAVVLVAEVTPSASIELRLAEGGPVWASVKASEVSVYPR
jgi:molybdate transport system ATP-binding protein